MAQPLSFGIQVGHLILCPIEATIMAKLTKYEDYSRDHAKPRMGCGLLISHSGAVFLGLLLGVVVYPGLCRWHDSTQTFYAGTPAEIDMPGTVVPLPPESSRISYIKIGGVSRLQVSYSTSEESFLHYASCQGWALRDLRKNRRTGKWSCFDVEMNKNITIEDGYYFHTIFRGSGPSFAVAFDRETNRGYYEFDGSARPNEN